MKGVRLKKEDHEKCLGLFREGKTLQEMSYVLGCSIAAVRSRVDAALIYEGSEFVSDDYTYQRRRVPIIRPTQKEISEYSLLYDSVCKCAMCKKVFGVRDIGAYAYKIRVCKETKRGKGHDDYECLNYFCSYSCLNKYKIEVTKELIRDENGYLRHVRTPLFGSEYRHTNYNI